MHQFLVSSDATAWNLPKGVIARLGRGIIVDLAFSPDGESLVVATTMGCWLYELPSMRPIALWETERGMVSTIFLSPNGKWIAASNWDGIIKVWETETQGCTAKIGCDMKFYDAITAGIRHIKENRLRAGLSILGIFIGVASVLCMMAIGDGAKKIIADDIEKLGGANHVRFWTRTSVRRRGRRYPTIERYTLSDAYAIEAECPDVTGVLPRNRRSRILVTNRKGGEFRSASLEGVTSDYAQLMRYDLQKGRFLSENDINNATQVCILGANVAAELFGDTFLIGQEVKLRHHRQQTPVRMRVVGTMAPKGRNLGVTWGSLDDAIYVPITTYQQRITGIGYVERLNIFFQKGTDVYDLVKSVRKVIREKHGGTHNFTTYWIPKGTVKQLEHIGKLIKIALGGIAGFSLFVSGIGIMNICLVSVGEKTREIGLRKSVGARGVDIFWQFLTESICLCLCGGAAGIVGGWLAAHGMARLAVHIVPIVSEWPVVLSVPWMLTSVLFSFFMGVSFGVYPAMRAARLSPIDALHSED